MATKQYKITLTDEAVTFLKAEDSRGRLSEGIDRLVHRLKLAAVSPVQSHPHRSKSMDSPEPSEPAKVDPRNPTGNKNIQGRLDREDIEATAKLNKVREGFRGICQDIFTGAIPHDQLQLYMDDYNDNLTRDEMFAIYDDVHADHDGESTRIKTEYWAALNKLTEEREAEAANYKLLLAMGDTPKEAMAKMRPPQTLRLSIKALKGLGLFGTPESMTDAQITEINNDWESRDDESET